MVDLCKGSTMQVKERTWLVQEMEGHCVTIKAAGSVAELLRNMSERKTGFISIAIGYFKLK